MANFTAKVPLWSPPNPGARQDVQIDWSSAEKAYGNSIPQTARDQIEAATGAYLFHIQAESAAAAMKDARNRIEQIAKRCAILKDAIGETPLCDPDAQIFASQLINAEYRALMGIPPPDCEIPLRAFALEIEGVSRKADFFAEACNRAVNRLKEERGRRENETWEEWVRSMVSICEQHRLPTEARNDCNNDPYIDSDEKMESEFPRLIRTLVPDMKSPGALAKAINRAKAASQIDDGEAGD
jgi:hypothetical protein